MKANFHIGPLAVLGCMIMSIGAWAQQSSDVTEGNLRLNHGQINWTDRTIIATGSGAPNLNAATVAQARLGAERVAKLDALRNILEALKGVRISSEITVKNEMVTNSKMRTQVEGVARGFKVLKTKYYSDGGVDLVVQMSLDGSLSDIFVKPGDKGKTLPSTGKQDNTGLILDARGLRALPALAPQVLDESGETIYNSEYLDNKAIENNGVASYFHDLIEARQDRRAGSNPLVLKAMNLATGSKTDLMLSKQDADKLRGPKTNLKYLAEGKVIIVVD